MMSNRELRKRLQQSVDESFSTPSSTLMDRLPELARANQVAKAPAPVRVGRRLPEPSLRSASSAGSRWVARARS